uniref:DUF3719 domain-containing protein n=1 Tax=Schistocephalus solidus TaxID=70667 RepID=A0A0X3PXV0_SCHSO
MFDPSQIKPLVLSNSSGNSGHCHSKNDEISLTAKPEETRGMLSTECLIKSWLLQCDSAFTKARTTGTDFEFPPCKPVHHRGRAVSSPSLLFLAVEQGNKKEDAVSFDYSNQGKPRTFPTARPLSSKTDAFGNYMVKNKSFPPRPPKCIKIPTQLQNGPMKLNNTLKNPKSTSAHENVTDSSVAPNRVQRQKSLNSRSGALLSKAEGGLSTNSANDWYSMTSSDWADEVCEFDKEESYRVQQMFDAIDTILYETEAMLIGEAQHPVQRTNKHSTSPLDRKVSMISQYLGQNNGILLDPAIKELSSASHNQMIAAQGNVRPKHMLAGVEHLLSECQEWAAKFPHLRIRGAGIANVERTSNSAQKAITFSPGAFPKAETGQFLNPEMPELRRLGYVSENSELSKPLINEASSHQLPPSLNTSNYLPHLLVQGQQLSPRVPRTLSGMHLTTWSQHPRRISSGRHSAPKSMRPSALQHSKLRNVLTDDLAIACVGSCSYATDNTTTAKLGGRILSTPDPHSRALNLLTRSKTETIRLSGRSRLSPVESISPGPRTPTEGTPNWRTEDQLSLYSKNLRVKSEQSTRKMRLARSVQKLSELPSDNPPQYAVHINTVSDISAVIKEELLAIIFADAAAAVFAVTSGNADCFQAYLRSRRGACEVSGKHENTTQCFRTRLSDSPNDDSSQWRAEDERTEALMMNRTKLFSPIPDFSTLGSALNISSKTLQQRTSGTEFLSGRLNVSDVSRQHLIGEDSLNRQSTLPPGCLNIPNVDFKNPRKQHRSSRPTLTQKGSITLPTECSNQLRIAHANLVNTMPSKSDNALNSGRLGRIDSVSGTLPALGMHSATEDSSVLQVVPFRWRLNSKQPPTRVPVVPEHQVLSTSQPNLAGGDFSHRTQVLPPIVLNANLPHCSKGLAISWTENDGDLPQEERPSGFGKAKTCRVTGTGGIKRVSSSLFPAGGLPSISSTVSSHVTGADGLPASNKIGPHRSMTKFPEYASALAVQHSTTLPPTALATQKMPVTALHAVSVHKHWDQFSSSSKVTAGESLQANLY